MGSASYIFPVTETRLWGIHLLLGTLTSFFSASVSVRKLFLSDPILHHLLGRIRYSRFPCISGTKNHYCLCVSASYLATMCCPDPTHYKCSQRNWFMVNWNYYAIAYLYPVQPFEKSACWGIPRLFFWKCIMTWFFFSRWLLWMAPYSSSP